MLYRFRDRDTGRFYAAEGKTRLDAQCKLPIGSWVCYFVETDDSVEPFNPTIHERP